MKVEICTQTSNIIVTVYLLNIAADRRHSYCITPGNWQYNPRIPICKMGIKVVPTSCGTSLSWREDWGNRTCELLVQWLAHSTCRQPGQSSWQQPQAEGHWVQCECRTISLHTGCDLHSAGDMRAANIWLPLATWNRIEWEGRGHSEGKESCTPHSSRGNLKWGAGRWSRGENREAFHNHKGSRPNRTGCASQSDEW